MNATDQPTGPDDQTPALRPSGKLARQILDLVEQHERETVAARALAGDPNPTDADPLDYVREIAEHYAQWEQRPEYRDQLISHIADSLSLDDVRALRLAGEAAVAATPEVIRREAEADMSVPRIAHELGVTPSYVYTVRRKQRSEGDQ